MSPLSVFEPHLDERQKEEFLNLSLGLLSLTPIQSEASLNAGALRFTPEPPRDPDLPVLPPKHYPRIDPTASAQALSLLTPPRPTSEWVGAAEVLERAVTALLNGRPLRVSGTGKTTFLRRLAQDQRLLGVFRRVWWLDDLREAGAIMGIALESPNLLIAPPEAQPAQLRERLIEGRILILADSDQGVNNGAAWLLGCSPHVVIATDSPLSNALSLVLGELEPNRAGAWLAGLTGQAEDTCRALCALVDHRPDAISVMGALMTEDGLDPAAITAILAETPDNPESRLDALYKASFEALPENYQVLCASLAATGKNWIKAETILTRFTSPLAGQRALTFLEKRHFVERIGEQVRIIGKWAGRVIRGEGFSAFALPPSSLELLHAGIDNSTIADSFSAGVTLIQEGRDEEAISALREALKARQKRGDHYGAAQVMMALGRIGYLRGEDVSAASQIEDAGRILHTLRDEDGLEIVRVALSRIYRRMGRLDAALAVLGEDSAPADVAMVYRMRGAWGEAAAVYERWIVEAESKFDPEAAAAARFGLAETYLAAGRIPEALRVAANDQSFYGRWIQALGAHLNGDWEQAIRAYNAAQHEAPPAWRGILARAQGRALAQKGAVEEAARLVGAEGIWYEANQVRPVFARQKASQALYAHLRFMLGDDSEADRAARAVRQISGERSDPFSEATASRVLGRIGKRAGAFEAAAIAFEAESNALGGVPHRDDHEIGIALHEMAEAQQRAGLGDRAVANYRRALTLKDEHRDRQGTATTALALAMLLWEMGRYVESLEAGGRAVDILIRPPGGDLAWIGFSECWLAQRSAEAERNARGAEAFDEWLKRLGKHLQTALSHDHPGVRALAIGLYLRSDPPLDNPVELIDLAEQALELCAAFAPPEQHPAYHAARRDLGRLYLRLERWSDAHEVLSPLLVLPSEVVGAYPWLMLETRLSLAQAAAHVGLLEDALRHFEAAAALEPDTHAQGLIAREMARLCTEQGFEGEAVRCYDLALGRLSRERDLTIYTETLIALAYVRLRMRRFSEAIDTFDHALHIVEGASQADSTLLANVFFDKARAHATLGQFASAAENYRRSLNHQDTRRESDQVLETIVALARAWAQAGQYQQAVEAYFDALQFESISPDQRRVLLTEQADSFVKIGQAQAAINAYDSALGIEGASPLDRAEIHRGLGAIFTNLGSHDRARKHLKLVLEAVQDDRTGMTLKILGDGYRAQGMGKEALDSYHKALNFLRRDQYPTELAATERALGELYLERGQFANAIAHLEKALELERSRSQQQGGAIVAILNGLASAHEKRGELDKATIRLHEALVYLDPRHTPERHIETLRELGRLYLSLNRAGEAARAYEESLKVEKSLPNPDPDRLDAITLGMGSAREMQGQLEEAAALYQGVIARARRPSIREEAQRLWDRLNIEIERHLQTLRAAEQSLILIQRSGADDPVGTAFVRALQAQASAALGRGGDTQSYLDTLVESAQKGKKALGGDESAARALTLIGIAGGVASDPDQSLAQLQEANDLLHDQPRTHAALIWAVQQLIGRLKRGS
ncbi:MAG: tetratricopeptide repeat protein [Anaerolinea sp.]|nr:tetratricopeptide repeat protein [Anaerolinea sp.]